jgi:hypothetical protein
MTVANLIGGALLIPLLLARVNGAEASSSAAATDPRATAAASAPGLDWRYIESEDYRIYIANLQAIGCPPQTVRDIVTTDVNSLFAGRRNEALKARYQNFQYWKSDPSETEARAALNAQRRAVDAEMNADLQELLGADTPLPDVTREWQSADLDFKLAFLPADKLAQTKAILLEHDHTDQQAKQLCDGNYVTEDTNELKSILDSHDQGRAALRDILSTEQFERVEMTTSWTAENLRHALVYFVPTEAEFRVIFAAWKERDEQLVRINAARETDLDHHSNAVHEKIKSQLTEERYKAYRDTWWK